jgi:phosphoribosylamine--glycine ligase
MDFLFISKEGSILPLADRVRREGNNVLIYIDEVLMRDRAYEGLKIKKINRKELGNFIEDKSYIKVWDETGQGKIADKFMNLGHHVAFAAGIADQLEDDRKFGMKIMQQVGIKIPNTHEFLDFAQAKKFVQENPDKTYVFKPSTLRGNVETIKSFILQEYISGISCEVEGWFVKDKFILPFMIEMEEKKYANNNLGPMVGQAGTVIFPSPVGIPKIIKEGIMKIQPILQKYNYSGPVSLNSIIRGDELYGLEFTARPGYDSIYAFSEGLKMDVGKFCAEIAQKTLDYIEFDLESYLASVRVSIPPYPYNCSSAATYISQDAEDMLSYLDNLEKNPVFENMLEVSQLKYPDGKHAELTYTLKNRSYTLTSKAGIKINGIRGTDRNHIHFFDVKSDEFGNALVAGADGIICAVTSSGQTIEEAIAKVYGICDNMEIANKYYRTDIGQRAIHDYEILKADGWFDAVNKPQKIRPKNKGK